MQWIGQCVGMILFLWIFCLALEAYSFVGLKPVIQASRASSLYHSVGCEVQVFEDAAELKKNVARDFADNAIACISERDAFYAAVPGGSVLEMLRSLVPIKTEVDWSEVFLYCVHHKIVPASDTGGTHTKGLSLFSNECGIPSSLPTIFSFLEDKEHFPVCGVQGETWMIDETCARGLDEYSQDDERDFEYGQRLMIGHWCYVI